MNDFAVLNKDQSITTLYGFVLVRPDDTINRDKVVIRMNEAYRAGIRDAKDEICRVLGIR